MKRLALLAAFCSGCATLTYELAWLRELTLSVGSTFPALSAILTGFMGGMGIGAWLGGRRADRSLRPARALARLELAIALVALPFPHLSSLLLQVPGGEETLPLRVLLASALVVPPAALMGASFTMFSRLLHEPGARHLPGLYGVHTSGAALGALAGSMIGPYLIGVRGTELAAGVLNLASAALVCRAGLRPPAPGSGPGPLEAPAGPSPGTDPSPNLKLLLGGFALGSGILTSLGELFWTRTILLTGARHPLLPPDSTDAFALVLAVLLLGQGLGSLLSRSWPRRGLGWLAPLHLALGAACLISMEWTTSWLGRHLTPGESSSGLIALTAALLPSLLMGISFPLVGALASGRLEDHGQALGRIWLINAAGSAGAALLLGWPLIAWVGTGGGLVACAALSLLLAWLAARSDPGGSGPRRRAVAAASLVIMGAGLSIPRAPGQTFRLRDDPPKVQAAWESIEAITLVTEEAGGDRKLLSNGRDVSDRDQHWGDLDQVLRLAPGARHLLQVGFSTGRIAQAMLALPTLEELVIVELDGGQRYSASWFGTGQVLLDPRVRFITDDALHYVTTTTKRFDLVTIAAWDPEASPTVYTEEFHRRLRGRLSERGVVWMKFAERGPVVDAMRVAYPHTYRGDSGLLASLQPLPAHLEAFPPPTGAEAPLRHLYPRRLRFSPTHHSIPDSSPLTVADLLLYTPELQGLPGDPDRLSVEQIQRLRPLLPELRRAGSAGGAGWREPPGTPLEARMAAIYTDRQRVRLAGIRARDLQWQTAEGGELRSSLPTEPAIVLERYERFLVP